MKKQELRFWRTARRLLNVFLFALFSLTLYFVRTAFRTVHFWLRSIAARKKAQRDPAARDHSPHETLSSKSPVSLPPAQAPRAIPPAEPVVLPTIPPSRYRVFVPSIAHAKASRWGRNRRPLLVLLHGCLQTASTMESGTRMNETAEREGFFVLYPDQARGRNMMNCWNWFDPRNQRPYSGELAEILAMIKQIEAEYAIDHERIYVAGLSSGAATAASLLACHPDRFAGGLLHSGPAYASAQGLFEGAHAMRLGPMVMAEDSLPANPKAFSGRLLLVQGDRDHIVHPSHQQRLVEQFATRDELSSAHSWSWRAPASDPSVSAPETYSAHLTAYGSGRAETPRICRVTIEGLGHAWSGGKNTSFNDPRGPSINEAFVRYFLKGELPLPEAAPALKELS